MKPLLYRCSNDKRKLGARNLRTLHLSILYLLTSLAFVACSDKQSIQNHEGSTSIPTSPTSSPPSSNPEALTPQGAETEPPETPTLTPFEANGLAGIWTMGPLVEYLDVHISPLGVFTTGTPMQYISQITNLTPAVCAPEITFCGTFELDNQEVRYDIREDTLLLNFGSEDQQYRYNRRRIN